MNYWKITKGFYGNFFVVLMFINVIFWGAAPAHANFWSSISSCLSDPCNCGDSNDEVWEEWNGARSYKGKKNKLCPPWNKGDGRKNNICLVKSSYPDAWTKSYRNICAEEVKESTYLQPKIRVRGQQCNAVACWATANILGWDGQCVNLAGAYGLPLHRMCARVAVPATTGDNPTPQDPGYTSGVHLDRQGATVNDELMTAYDGTTFVLNSPKLCLYRDPGAFTFEPGVVDLLDLNPNKQPFHKTNEVHPVVKVLMFFVELSSESGQMPFQLLSSLFGMINDGNDGQTTVASVLQDMFQFIGWIINEFGNLIIDVLQQYGQINSTVDNTIYGCVQIPLGSYPPPYAPTLESVAPSAYTQKICHNDANGIPVESTELNPCVVSMLDNNLVQNVIRISFMNFVPICPSGQLPNSDKCVAINNLGVSGSASALHNTVTARTDILPVCSSAQAGQPCVNTTIPHRCSVTTNGCQGGFRVVYGIKMGSTIAPQAYFRDDLADCNLSNQIACQQIWGVNTAEFVDVALTFPETESASNIASLESTINLTNNNLNSVEFSVFIPRVAVYDENLDFTPDPGQICVIEGQRIVGCENRAPYINPTVYSCDSDEAPLVCQSDYFHPRFIASISQDGFTTSIIVDPPSVYNSSATDKQINLAGYDFDSFVTDSTLVEKPFTDPRAPNSSSLFGNYRDNNVVPNAPDAVYLYGLEYINDKYHVGGALACLKNSSAKKCPEDTKNCVLSSLLNSNVVDCAAFTNLFTEYPSLTACAANTTPSGCNIVKTVNGSTAGKFVRVYSCPATLSHCYTISGTSATDICKVSRMVADRVDPAASFGEYLSNDQYYNVQSSSFNRSVNGLRDKTANEQSLCVEVPQGRCRVINNPSESTGYALWPETNVGQQATGTCAIGKVPLRPLVRYCVPNPETQSFEFEPLPQDMVCQ